MTERELKPEDPGDEDKQRLIDEALGTYSADGQVDDATGGDAGAEEEFGHGETPRETGAGRMPPSPEGRTGPA